MGNDGTGTSGGGSTGGQPPDVASLVDDESEAGFYSPDSITWRVNRERVLQLNGLPGILLAYAHPKVAQSVVDYTDVYENSSPTDPFRVTIEVIYDITFDDLETARQTARKIRALHERTTGTLDEDVGQFSAGDRYDASDPELLLWVHAVVIDQALTAYETYVGTLTDEQKARYYAESQTAGQLLGIPKELYPDGLDAFYTYYEQMLEDELAVGRAARAIREGLVDVAGGTRPLHTTVAGGTLPTEIRTDYGLPWSRSRRVLFDGLVRLVRTTLSGVPARHRYVEAYREAER